MDALSDAGWQFTPAGEALADPFYDQMPETLTNGRSLLDVLAEETGTATPVYPARGAEFGVPAMQAAGL